MQRFKFRIWDSFYNIMLDESLLGEKQLCRDILPERLLNPTEYAHIMQSTGLRDKNGKLIFEGDILEDMDLQVV